MGLFSSSDSKDSGKDFEGECMKCPEKVSGRTAKEATEAAMSHAGDKHGDRFLGFRWK